MRISVIGGGSFGTALAKILAEAGRDVLIWCHNPEVAAAINRDRENSVYLPGFKLPVTVCATSDLQLAVADSEYLLAMGPSHVMRQVMTEARPSVRRDALVISAAKGIEEGSHLCMSRVLRESLGPDFAGQIAVISGPSFAREIAAGLPTAVTAASNDSTTVERVQEVLRTPMFRVYSSLDLIGVEVGGAAKNVIAIAAGVSDGLGLGSSSRAALITRGVAEIARLVIDLGGDARTVSGLSGVGDIVLTCTGDLSRNRTVGMRIGQGEKLSDILAGMKMVAEGVQNSKSVCELAAKSATEMPIAEEVRKLLHEDKPAREVIGEFMRRQSKPEF